MALQHKKAKSVEGILDAPMSSMDLVMIHEASSPYFDKIRKSGSENELYLRGENLSEQQKKDIYGQGRIPFPMGLVADKAQKFIAYERNNRISFKVLPKKIDAEVKTVLATMRLKDVESGSDGEYAETDIVASGIGAKFGVGKIYTEKDRNLETVVRYKKVDWSKFGWDNNAQTYDKNDGAFMYEQIPTYRRDIRMDYGKKVADEIEIGTPNRFERGNIDYWGISNTDGNRDMDIINIYEHYQKVIRTRYYVVFGGEVDFVGNSKKEADQALKSFKVPYIVLGQPIPQAEIVPVPELGIDKYVFTYNEILEYEETDYKYFPYSIYQSFWFEDEVWCIVDILKSPAKFADKLISQIDYAFGADIKNGWEIVENWLGEGVDINEAIRRVKAGEPVPVLHTGAIHSVPSKGANPQWIQMYEVMQMVIGDLSGGVWSGQNPQGKQREAQGTVQMKMMQGGMIPALFIDNKIRWKLDLGRKLLWWLRKYDTAKHIIKCHGQDLKPEMIQLLQQHGLYQPSPSMKHMGYIEVNTNELSYLDDADYDLQISTTETSETQKNARLQQLQMLKQNGIQIPPSIWLELLPLDYDLKQEIIQATAQAQKAEAQDKEDAKGLELLKATRGEGNGAKEVENSMAADTIQKKKQLNQPQPANA